MIPELPLLPLLISSTIYMSLSHEKKMFIYGIDAH